MNSSITEAAYFFNNSSKRQNFLEAVVDKATKQLRLRISVILDGFIVMRHMNISTYYSSIL